MFVCAFYLHVKEVARVAFQRVGGNPPQYRSVPVAKEVRREVRKVGKQSEKGSECLSFLPILQPVLRFLSLPILPSFLPSRVAGVVDGGYRPPGIVPPPAGLIPYLVPAEANGAVAELIARLALGLRHILVALLDDFE